MATVLLAGTVLTGAGVAVVGATVEVFDRATTTPVRATFTGGTDASGNWNFAYDPGANSRRVDVRITNGTSISFLKHDDQVQVSSVETANLRIINPAFTYEYNIVPAAITAARQLNLPLITATDTLAVLGLAQTFSAVLTLSATTAFTAASPFSVANGQTLTVSTTAQTVGAATLTIPNFAGVADTFAFTTLAQTLSNKTLSAPVFSGAYSFGGTPTFGATMAGASTFSGAITLSAAGNSLVVNTTTLVVDATNARVGIGTASPGSTLHLVHNSGLGFQIERTSATAAKYSIGVISTGKFQIGQESGTANDIILLPGTGANIGIGTTAPSTLLHVGLAGTTLGTIGIAGNTSGLVTIRPAAAAGTWTFQVPADGGTNGQQLQTDGTGITSWAAAGSWREWKNILQTWDNPHNALAQMIATPVHDFRYRPDGLVTTGDFESLYTGVLAEEAPWAMHHGGKVVNPVNTLGYMVLGFQAVDQRLVQLEAENKALRLEVSGLRGR